MNYVLYAARDDLGAFSFVKPINEAPPDWSGLHLQIAGVYAEKGHADRGLLEMEERNGRLWSEPGATLPPGVPTGRRSRL